MKLSGAFLEGVLTKRHFLFPRSGVDPQSRFYPVHSVVLPGQELLS